MKLTKKFMLFLLAGSLFFGGVFTAVQLSPSVQAKEAIKTEQKVEKALSTPSITKYKFLCWK